MIYKYYPNNDNTFDALKNCYFYFRKVCKLNDPYDCSFSLLNSDAYIKKLENLGMAPNAKEIMRNYGTCSFSKCKDNMHLWSLYASNFSGIVIGYDEHVLNTEIPVRNSGVTPLIEVDYVEVPIDFENPNSTFTLKYQNDNPRTNTIENALKDNKIRNDLFLYLCSMKEKTTWSSEKELRLIAPNRYLNTREMQKHNQTDDENGYKICIPNNAIKEIIVGHNFDMETNAPFLSEIKEKYGIKNVQHSVCNTPFEITFENISIL